MKVILPAGVMFIMWVAGTTQATEVRGRLEQELDSLFVMASSGELRYREMVEPAKAAIAGLGIDVVPLLIDKFVTKSARERLTIIQILEKIGSKAVPALVRALQRENGLVVQRVCWSLGNIGDSGAVPGLVAVGNHPRWQVRDQAVGALGKIADPRGAGAVIKALADSIGQVRKAAVVAAGQLKLDSVVAQLVGMLGDRFYGARLSAVNTLVSLENDRVVETIADSMSSENILLGNLACRVLGEIGTDQAMALLLSQTDSPDAGRRAHAARGLIMADPLDNCNFRRLFLPSETDRLVKLKIGSAIESAGHEN